MRRGKERRGEERRGKERRGEERRRREGSSKTKPGHQLFDCMLVRKRVISSIYRVYCI